MMEQNETEIVIDKYEEFDVEDLARELKNTIKQMDELKEYKHFLESKLASFALDAEGKILITQYGAFKYRRKQPYLKWEVDALAREVFRAAQEGKFHIDASGEVQGEADYRVFDALKKVFRFEPRKSEVKKMGLNVDEFATPTTDGEDTIQILG